MWEIVCGTLSLSPFVLSHLWQSIVCQLTNLSLNQSAHSCNLLLAHVVDVSIAKFGIGTIMQLPDFVVLQGFGKTLVAVERRP